MGIFSKWKPKTIVGKVIKGATIGLGTAATVATGIGAIAGVATGGGLLAGAIAGGGAVVKTAGKVAGAVGTGVKTVTSKVAGAAINLVTGTNKEQRDIIKEIKDEARDAKDKQQFAQKLMNLGKTESEANALAGITKTESESGTVKQTGLLGFLTEQRAEGEKDIKASVKKAGSFLIPALLLGGLLMFAGGKKKLF